MRLRDSSRRPYDRATLARLRAMQSEEALVLLASCLKADPTYRSLKNAASRRWHVRTTVGEFEILTTRAKWYDTRAKKGGGGAIDLAMHLEGISFMDAVKGLHRRLRSNG